MVILSVHSGKPLLFLPNPCNGKLLQSLHGVSLIMSLRHFPTSFSSRPFHHCPFWVSHGCADTAGWGGAICLEVIPTYWKPSPHVFFGQVSLPASSGPCLLACNTQAPHGLLISLIQMLWKALQCPGKSSNGGPFLPLCFSNNVRARDGLCLLKHHLFLLSGRKEWDQSFHISTFLYLVVFCPKSVRVCGSPGNESANLGAGNRLTWFWLSKI